MPVADHPRREREFKQLERDFKQEGHYRGREEEVAARTMRRRTRSARACCKRWELDLMLWV